MRPVIGLARRAPSLLGLLAACASGPQPAAAQPTAAQPGPATPDRQAVTIVGDVPYPGAAPGNRRRSLDLYLPADRKHRPPLLAFV